MSHKSLVKLESKSLEYIPLVDNPILKQKSKRNCKTKFKSKRSNKSEKNKWRSIGIPI